MITLKYLLFFCFIITTFAADYRRYQPSAYYQYTHTDDDAKENKLKSASTGTFTSTSTGTGAGTGFGTGLYGGGFGFVPYSYANNYGYSGFQPQPYFQPYPMFYSMPAFPFADINAIWNNYFNEVQKQFQNQFNQFNQFAQQGGADDEPEVSTRQISIGPFLPPRPIRPNQGGTSPLASLLPTRPQGSSPIATLLSNRPTLTQGSASSSPIASLLSNRPTLTQGSASSSPIASLLSRPQAIPTSSVNSDSPNTSGPVTGGGALQSIQRQLCLILQRLQLQNSSYYAVCNSQPQVPQVGAIAPFFGGGGSTFVASSGSSSPDGTQITVSAPDNAVITPIQGPGGVQGVHVSSQGPGNGGGSGFVGSFSSSSSTSSNVNGQQESHHSSVTGLNQNGQTTVITSHS